MNQRGLELKYSAANVDRKALRSMLETYDAGEPVHVVFIGTKPDIIKQYPVINELERRGLQVLVCHSGQHNEHVTSGAMLKEFDIKVGLRFVMSDKLSLGDRVAALITTANQLFSVAAESGHTMVPYIHGDTATSMGIGVAAYMNRVAAVHVEAGIRTLTPQQEFLLHHLAAAESGEFDWASYRDAHRLESTYVRGSREPFPEQFNTRTSDAATGFHAAPVELDRRFLLDEGYPADAIAVVGNTVVEATLDARDKAAKSNVLKKYPQLANGKFIRVCLHRRENTHDRDRFTCYFDAIERLLRDGHSVLWILLRGTKHALTAWDLQERLDALIEEFPDTFICKGLFAKYYDAMAAFRECALLATDSGSMQEEANVLEIGCVTLRFGTDRPESLLAGGNVLAPPLSPGFVTAVIEAAFDHRDDLKAEQLYGTDSAAKLVEEVLARVRVGPGLYRSEEEVLRLPGAGSPWPAASAEG